MKIKAKYKKTDMLKEKNTDLNLGSSSQFHFFLFLFFSFFVLYKFDSFTEHGLIFFQRSTGVKNFIFFNVSVSVTEEIQRKRQ